MGDTGGKIHWESVYTTKGENQVSWFQDSPALSLDLIDLAHPSLQSAIIDVGGGASRLVDALLVRGFQNVAVLDLSETALAKTKARLDHQTTQVQWIVADVTKWCPTQIYDVWHDRAAFHFLTSEADRASYAERLNKAVRTGGCVVIGTFALNGPKRCSGLPVQRYDSQSLAAILGQDFELIDSRLHDHSTPQGANQRFQFSTFRRR